MFELPRTRSPLPWYQQGRIKKWLIDLFALTSRKKTYTLQIGGSKGLAWVAPQLRRVYVTTKLPTTTEGHALLRFDPGNADARMELMLKGFMAHEAGHVRHSHSKPSGKIGRIWNCIEDERIERLMAAEFPELKVAFTFLGDIVNEQHRPKWSYTAMEGVLVWRFEHDRTTPRWQPRKADRDLWYDEILPRLEEGWLAPNSHEVERLAREIHALIKDHQEALNQQPPPQPQQDTPDETKERDDSPPEDTDSPEPPEPTEPDASQSNGETDEPDNEGQCDTDPPESDTTDSTDSTSTETDPNESPKPESDEDVPGTDENQPSDSDNESEPSSDEHGDEATTKQEKPGTPENKDGETEEQTDENQPSDSDDESEPSSEQDSSEAPSQDGGEDSGCAAQDNTDESESSSEDSPTSDDTALSIDTDSSAEGETATTDEDSRSKPQRPHPDDPGPESNVSPEQQAAENADDDEEPEAWDEVDASGTDADELDGTAEDDEGKTADDDQVGDDLNTTSGQSGKDAGKQSSLPTMPVPDRTTGEIIAKGVEGYARSLAPLLRPLDKPGQRRPHRSKGTYDVRRDLRGDEKVFQKKTEPTRSRPLTVKLLIDISISMGGDPIEAARQTAVMLVRAAALCQSKVHIHLFNSEHHPLITEPMPYTEAISLVSQINVSGGTTLNPSLKALTDEAIHPYESELIVVICDGELLPEDYSECKRIADEGRKLGKRYLPVLIGDAASYADEWKAVFGSALPCFEIRDIARTIQGSLTALRSRLG